jgi:glutathione-independent formaldehyde dehydrogenase
MKALVYEGPCSVVIKAQGHEVPNLTMNNLVQAVRPTGGIGVVGVFIAEDPGSPDELMKKGQHMPTGHADVKAYNPKLRDLIQAGKLSPSQIISHDLPLEQAPEGYKNFDQRNDGWTKVVLKAAG